MIWNWQPYNLPPNNAYKCKYKEMHHKPETCFTETEMEGEKLLEEVAVLDFESLCSAVAMQTQGGKWRVLENQQGEASGGVLRMWEGDLLHCFHHRPIALHTLCCPCYRFGNNMKRAGLGSSFLHGSVYLMFILLAAFNYIALIATRRHCFLYLALSLTIAVGAYAGFIRTRMRKKFNIRGNDSCLDDCMYHLACPCCSICQEARTLEMNNVQDGAWHGRGDTLCVGSFSPAGSTTLFELHPPPPISIACKRAET